MAVVKRGLLLATGPQEQPIDSDANCKTASVVVFAGFLVPLVIGSAVINSEIRSLDALIMIPSEAAIAIMSYDDNLSSDLGLIVPTTECLGAAAVSSVLSTQTSLDSLVWVGVGSLVGLMRSPKISRRVVSGCGEVYI